LNKVLPKVAEISVKICHIIFTKEALDLKIEELVAVAPSVFKMHQFCVNKYSRQAIDQKTSREEVSEAIMLTMLIAESSQLCGENAYGKNVYELIFGGDNSKEKGNNCNCSSGNAGK